MINRDAKNNSGETLPAQTVLAKSRGNSIRVLLVFPILFLKSSHVLGEIDFAQGIRDVKPPVDFPPNFLLILLVFLLFVVAIFLFGARSFVSRARKQKEEVVPQDPPWVAAQQRLVALRQENLPAKGQIKEYYTQLSNILRHYIEGRFEINAPDKTTEEFLWDLKAMSEFSVEQKQSLTDFLNCCDKVKFAKYASEPQEVETSFILVEKFVEETIVKNE